MTEVIPFRGIIYDKHKVQGNDVIAPPYDVISPIMREALYDKSPYNIVRIDFGKELPEDNENENKYTRARLLFGQWQKDGILRRDDKPVYYAYGMDYTIKGERKHLSGIFGAVKLTELGSGVYPHEATHSKPKADRWSLMTGLEANMSPIYSLYRSGKGDTAAILKRTLKTSPYLEGTDKDGTLHKLWRIESEPDIRAIQDELKSVDIFIADGHHRYETALDYRAEMRRKQPPSSEPAPHDYVLMFLAEFSEPGLTVLPTHRLVSVDVQGMKSKLSKYFDMEKLPDDADIVRAISGRDKTFGLYAGGRKYTLRYRDEQIETIDSVLRGLDVAVLHELILGKLLGVEGFAYDMDYEHCIGRVQAGDYDAAFFLNPTPVGDIESVAKSGLRMPPKSTYFFPKIQTGFVMNSLKSFS